jgi:hypothetical protein
MARERTFHVCGINIRVHSKHHPTEYELLWAALHDLGRIHVRGHLGLMIGDRRTVVVDGCNWVVGYFYTFLDIDPAQRWLDVLSRKAADEDTVHEVRIPENLRPNMTEIPYVFDTKNHHLLFVNREKSCALSAGSVHKLLKELTSTESIIQQFGTIDMTVLTDTSELEAMLSWPVIRKLHLTLERINPTDYEDDQEVFKRLSDIGAKREERTYFKDDEEPTLRVDESLRRVSHIAAQNGEVEVHGRDPSGHPSHAKSQKFPLVMKAEYSPAKTTLIDALIEFAVDSFKGRRNMG